MAASEGRLDEVLQAQVELPRKGLQKRPASRGAGLIELDAANEPLVHVKALHVLAADVDHVARLGIKGHGRALVRERLNLGKLGAHGRPRQISAVARGRRRTHVRALGNAVHQIAHALKELLKGIALVLLVPAVDDAPLLVEHHALERRAAQVDAEEKESSPRGALCRAWRARKASRSASLSKSGASSISLATESLSPSRAAASAAIDSQRRASRTSPKASSNPWQAAPQATA